MILFVFIYGKYGYLIILLINTLVLDIYIYIYIYKKSDAFDKFIEFKVKSNNLLGKHI